MNLNLYFGHYVIKSHRLLILCEKYPFIHLVSAFSNFGLNFKFVLLYEYVLVFGVF